MDKKIKKVFETRRYWKNGVLSEKEILVKEISPNGVEALFE